MNENSPPASNSTLCMKLGKNIENKSNPSGDNLLEKVFCRSNSSGLIKIESTRNLLMSASIIHPGAGPLWLNCWPINLSHKLSSELQLLCLVVLGYWCRPVNSSATCPFPSQCYEPVTMGSNSMDKGTCQDCGCSNQYPVEGTHC